MSIHLLKTLLYLTGHRAEGFKKVKRKPLAILGISPVDAFLEGPV